MNKLTKNFITLIFIDINILTCSWVLDVLGHPTLSGLAVVAAILLTVLFLGTLVLLGKEEFK